MDFKEEESEQSPNMLSAEELLRNKGIRSSAWNNWERSMKALPKSGQKLFEPNGSILQKMQIEKGIRTRKELMSIERVERLSQLACAEWLSAEKKAHVTKRSGQDWSNFGVERNSALYLMPEEALLLLEMNCLELTWNGVAMSIQQAYDVLIDDEICSLEEYRVYSQLVRHGYRIQRFLYEQSDKKPEENGGVKRKVIVNPENGLRMDNCKSKGAEIVCEDIEDVEEDVRQTLEEIVCKVENAEAEKSQDSSEKRNGNDKRGKNKVEIISEETLLEDIKIVKTSENSKKWPGSRIQRNVKLMPKRNDKSQNDVSVIDTGTAEKRKADSQISNDAKRSKHEIIELSDDEIQEVPRPMTRMEMLNLLPNIANQSIITQKISRGYIPHSVKPQKTVYRYEKSRLQNLKETDRKLRSNYEHTGSNSSGRSQEPRNSVVPYHSRIVSNMYDTRFIERAQFMPFCYNRFPFVYQNFWHNRSIFTQQSIFHNAMNFIAFENLSIRNRYLSVQMNNFAIPFMGRTIIRNQYRHSFYHMTPHHQVYHHRGQTSVQDAHPRQVQRAQGRSENEVYETSFKKLPGTSSWTELKKKWKEERTITIDDEEPNSEAEVEVVREFVNPLVGCRNAGSLAEVFDRLRIIKSAPEKTPRRKRGKYRISYNVYSNTQHYRKANPGTPLYRIVVVRQKEDQFIQPIELMRLQQDAKDAPIMLAVVSMTISFIQPGIVSIPEIT